ncbi:hypothetical protein IP70_20580 [alpha proteobacterium AAP38]|nr:hypothetical protein IP70_20580 [alpha proteobacterium AAP38]
MLALALAIACWIGSAAAADPTILRMAESREGSHLFFHDVLKAAFQAENYPIELQGIAGPGKERYKMMLRNGDLDVMWMVRGAERDRQYVPVDFPLTGGLIGQRVLLIRPEDQAAFDQIRRLEDFARLGLVAGMGKDWLDVDIWRQNSLPVSGDITDWRLLFKMLAAGNRAIDYMPRGVSEVMADAQAHPELVIEKRLLLRYRRDSIFYLAPPVAHLAPVLLRGLRKVRDNGTYDRLVQKHYGHLKTELALDQRLILDLVDQDDRAAIR